MTDTPVSTLSTPDRGCQEQGFGKCGRMRDTNLMRWVLRLRRGEPGRKSSMSNVEMLARIDAAIAEKNLLKHPFYQDWQAGKLSREALQLYAAQYYRHVEAFPKHLRALAARAEGAREGLIRENVAEEENPAGPHPKLWRDFAAAG